MKLLIVDDSAMVRRLIQTAYSGSFFTDIQTASDGILAVTMYKQFNPDIVTLDITMPHMDGLAALAQILEHNKRAKVLVISALADHHTAIESLKRGASQFICKPFTADELKTALDEVMNPSRGRRSRRRKRDRTITAPTYEQAGPDLDQYISSASVEPSQPPIPPSSIQDNVVTPGSDAYPSGYVPPPVISSMPPQHPETPKNQPPTPNLPANTLKPVPMTPPQDL